MTASVLLLPVAEQWGGGPWRIAAWWRGHEINLKLDEVGEEPAAFNDAARGATLAIPSPIPRRSEISSAVPSRPYVADFYCPAAKLVIEIDGQIHDFQAQAERDLRRDDVIKGFGVRVHRIAAIDVMNNATSVASAIFDECLASRPLHHPALPDGPPPRDKLGEDMP